LNTPDPDDWDNPNNTWGGPDQQWGGTP
jgi:hypothetical protein